MAVGATVKVAGKLFRLWKKIAGVCVKDSDCGTYYPLDKVAGTDGDGS